MSSNISHSGNLTSGVVFIPQHGNIGDGLIRGIFKTYFLIMLLAIAFIGTDCSRALVKLNLLRSKTVSVTMTTGWMQGAGLLNMIWELRALPGGWLGWLMLISTALDFVGEYCVAVTVRLRPQKTTAIRSNAMIMNSSTANVESRPNVQWGANRWATAAQLNSYTNGYQSGLGDLHYGIYRLVTNDTDFMARKDDEIGYWSCTRTTPAPIIYDQAFKGNKKEVYDNDIWTDLYKRDLLYGAGYYPSSWNVTRNKNGTAYGPSTHTIILTSSNYTVGNVFEIRAAVDTNDIDTLGTKQIHTYGCVLRARDSEQTVFKIARQIDIDYSLSKWSEAIAGAMFPDVRGFTSYPLNDLEITLQRYLNSMIMVAGSGESLSSPNTAGIEVGIVQMGTVIPYWIIVVASVVAALLLSLGTYFIFLLFAVEKAQIEYDRSNQDSKKVLGKEILDNTPIGLLEWMAHAAYESRDASRKPESKELRKWILSTTWHAGQRLGIVTESDHGRASSSQALTFPPHHASTPLMSGATYKHEYMVDKHEVRYF
ncbi:hypothetical protein H2198_009021 [Neophaeococcomyces mojaviensis]|uniref:Uncharacterized protein n=1 Tax=Neophaeococcomyces mojaviensis TaxID=3383035 RepID=A0ACC2ZVR8_9EURO|nr:hypothetical protein H2198_009021 [Knufia sp. JES_112]